MSALFLHIWHRQPLTSNQMQNIDTMIRRIGKVLHCEEESWLLKSDNPKLQHPRPVDILIDHAESDLLKQQLMALRDDIRENAVIRTDRRWAFWLEDSTALPGSPPVGSRQRPGLWGHTVNLSISYDVEHILTGIGETFQGTGWIPDKINRLSQMLEWWGYVPRAGTRLFYNPSGLDWRIIGYLALFLMEETDGRMQLIPRTLSLPQTLEQLRLLSDAGKFPGKSSPNFYMDSEFLRAWLQHPDFSLW
jgi:hypothetical protein